MNMQFGRPSEARLLTDRLRANVSMEQFYDRQQTISERDGNLQMVLDGAVLRQRHLGDGRCQTVAVYYRDDVINLARFVRKHESRDELVALRGTMMGSVEPAVVKELRRMSLSGVDGMAALVLRELGINQERLTSLGQRSAIQALAHFMCETLYRCRDVDDASATNCALPMTQDALAGVLGITSVHVSRTLNALRARRLAQFVRYELKIHDLAGLADLAEFDDAYLAPV